MAKKFNRNYLLSIQTNTVTSDNDIEFIQIEPPFTVIFSIVRSNMAALNSMQMDIYNLSEKSRSKIFQDRIDPTVYKRVIFQAGYGNLSTVFQGNLFRAFSMRQGSNILTKIDCRDGDFDTRNTSASITYNKGVKKEDILLDLLSGFTFLKKGKITSIEGNFNRPVVIDENSFFWIKKNVDGVFVDLEQVNILKDDEVFVGDVPLINTEGGLLGTPQRENSFLSVTTIFEPRVVIGQAIEIESKIQKQYNGQYKVIGIKHSGVISESMGGSLTTTFNLLTQSQLFGEFKEVS